MDIFQILVGAGLLLMAVITAVTLTWAFSLDAKLRAQREKPDTKTYDVHIDGTKIFTEEDLVLAGVAARDGLESVVKESSKLLQDSLAATISGLSTKTEDMATITLSQEFEKYQVSLAALRDETIKEFNDLQKQLDERKKELVTQLEDHVAKDREARMDLFNERLGDVVSSYIVETLDKGVDLGAQTAYIARMLEEHKADIKKDVLS